MTRSALLSRVSCALALFTATLQAQTIDFVAAERELTTALAPAENDGADAAATRLDGFLRRYEGRDLGRLGYSRAFAFHFRHDSLRGAAALDEFFAHHDQIGNAQHAEIAGQVYLAAVRELSTRPNEDAEHLDLWAERVTALGTDLLPLAREGKRIAAGCANPPAFRMALVRGMLKTSIVEADRDRFLSLLYSPIRAGEGMDVVPIAPVPNEAKQLPSLPGPAAGQQTEAKADADGVRIGAAVPDLPFEQSINASDGFRLADLRGKVVVLDFFATWCPPCRTGIDKLVALQKKYAGSLQVIGVTRFYTKGMDFAGGAAKPHGGKSVLDLDRVAEFALNTTFAKTFEIDYPILFTTEQAMKHTFGVTAIPTTFVIGKDGIVLGRIMGNDDIEEKKLNALVTRGLETESGVHGEGRR